MAESLIRKPDDPGYIVAWRDKYEHVAGKYTDDVLTYAQAQAKAETLCEQHPEKTFWAEKLSEALSNRFYNPAAH